ncbi:hypothetical protein [Nonomuraea sp. NPDC049695]|uniref:hypothetical protein n=1 Tax=Nonomuraea sp. NPDC049695 TaxID=3154734 RepID=UPI003430DBF1
MNNTPDTALAQALRRLRDAGGDGRSLDHETLAVIRRAAIARMQAGERPAALAREYGLARGTLYYWRSLAAEGNPRATQAAPEGRTPYKVSPKRREQLRQAVLSDPRTLGLTRPLWTRGLVRWYLREHLNTDISANHVRLLLQQLRLWPATNPPTYSQQCELAPGWAETEFGRIRARADAAGSPVYFLQIIAVGDGVRLMSLVQTKGAARDFALLTADDGPEQACGVFLERVLALHGDTQVVLIGDPLIAPSMRAMASAAARHNGRITLIHLPAPQQHAPRAALYEATLEEHRQELLELRAAAAAIAADAEADLAADGSAAVGLFGGEAGVVRGGTTGPALAHADAHAGAHTAGQRQLLDTLGQAGARRRHARRLATRYAHLQALAEAAQARGNSVLGQVRQELNQLLRAGRELGISAPELAAATALTRNAVNLLVRRTPLTPTALNPVQVLEAATAQAALWRRAKASYHDSRQLSIFVAELKAKAVASERQARDDRDRVIAACAREGLAGATIAAAAQVSDSLVYTITNAGSMLDVGDADEQVQALRTSMDRWRQAREQGTRARQRLLEHQAVRRQAGDEEESWQERRNLLIRKCVASGYTTGEISTWADLDHATVRGQLSVLAGEVSLEEGQQALQELAEVSRSWRQAQQRAAEQRARGERLILERRRCLDQEEAARRERNRALLACRRAGLSIATLATLVRADSRMIREALQAGEASEEHDGGEEVDTVDALFLAVLV